MMKLTTIVSIGDAHTAANDASPLEGSVVALVADVNDGGGVDEGVANDTFAVAFFAEASDGDAGLLAAHD